MFRKRTTMKKLTMTAAAMLGLSLCFTGCGGKDEPIPEPELQEVLRRKMRKVMVHRNRKAKGSRQWAMRLSLANGK